MSHNFEKRSSVELASLVPHMLASATGLHLAHNFLGRIRMRGKSGVNVGRGLVESFKRGAGIDASSLPKHLEDAASFATPEVSILHSEARNAGLRLAHGGNEIAAIAKADTTQKVLGGDVRDILKDHLQDPKARAHYKGLIDSEIQAGSRGDIVAPTSETDIVQNLLSGNKRKRASAASKIQRNAKKVLKSNPDQLKNQAIAQAQGRAPTTVDALNQRRRELASMYTDIAKSPVTHRVLNGDVKNALGLEMARNHTKWRTRLNVARAVLPHDHPIQQIAPLLNQMTSTSPRDRIAAVRAVGDVWDQHPIVHDILRGVSQRMGEDAVTGSKIIAGTEKQLARGTSKHMDSSTLLKGIGIAGISAVDPVSGAAVAAKHLASTHLPLGKHLADAQEWLRQRIAVRPVKRAFQKGLEGQEGPGKTQREWSEYLWHPVVSNAASASQALGRHVAAARKLGY